jgi:hypothetical protein
MLRLSRVRQHDIAICNAYFATALLRTKSVLFEAIVSPPEARPEQGCEETGLIRVPVSHGGNITFLMFHCAGRFLRDCPHHAYLTITHDEDDKYSAEYTNDCVEAI